jgi:rsbT co-antagonist protein RsbR
MQITLTRYRVTAGILVLLPCAIALILAAQPPISRPTTVLVAGLTGMLAYIILLVAHLRGWRWSAEVAVISMTLGAIMGATPEYMQAGFFVTMLVPMVFTAVLLTPRWTLVIFGITVVGTALNVSLQAGTFSAEVLGPTYQFAHIVLMTILAAGVALTSTLARQAQRAAEANAQRAEAALVQAEQQARDLAEANTRMNAQLDQQRELLDLVATLETPAVTLADGVLFVPIVGHLDQRRAEALTNRLLHSASAQRARLVIVDIVGLSVIDTGVAQALLNTAQALRLLGCAVTFSGISANIAVTLTHLNIGLMGVGTVRSPQEALAQYEAKSHRARANSSVSV